MQRIDSKANSSLTFRNLTSTAVFLITVFSSIKTVGKTSDKKMDLDQFRPTYRCEPSLGIVPFTLTNPTQLTPEYISRFIEGTPEDCGFVAQFVSEMIQTNPDMAQYMSLSLNHLPGFKIKALTKEQYAKILPKGYAAYESSQKITYLKDVNKNPDLFAIMTNIRHELRHAAMNTAQQLLSSSLTTASHCYFPLSSVEKAKLQAAIDAGDKRTIELEKKLVAEMNGKLSVLEREELNQIRSQNKEEYLKYYQQDTFFSATTEELRQYERIIGQRIAVGEVVDGYKIFGKKNPSGDLLVREITPNENNKFNIVVTYLDPLIAAVSQIPVYREGTRSLYQDDIYVFERDASLHGVFPQGIIKYIFRELYEHTHDLLNQALWIAEISKNPTKEKELYDTLTGQNLEGFKAANAGKMFAYARYAIANGKIDEARMGLKTLIQKGHYKTESNLELARLETNAHNYNDALRYYKRAIKLNADLTSHDHLIYAQLLREDFPKAAIKQQKLGDRLFEQEEARMGPRR